MKERPILFTPAMAAAVYAGTKTQTRRVVKRVENDNRMRMKVGTWTHVMDAPARGLCPYGVPGDRLYVREAVTIVDFSERGDGTPADHFRAEVTFQNGQRGFHAVHMEKWRLAFEKGKRFPNIHMPRWACRSVLELVGVRVERVESIRTEDAIAEGFDNNTHFLNTFYKINKRAPEGSNPWVWVIEFRRLGVADAGGCCPPAPPAEGEGQSGGGR